MNLVEEVDPYNVDTLLTLSQYRAFQSRFPAKATEELDTRIEEIASEIASGLEAGRKHNVYSDKQKAVFYYFNGIKLCKAAPSSRKAQIEPHTAQNLRLETSFCMSAAWPSREQPLARNSAENLEKRYQQVKKWVKTTDMKYLTNRIFVDEAGFNINMKSPNARSVRGTPAIVETPTTRAIAHTIVGAITAQDVISVEIREPLKSKKVKVDGSRKRKKSVAKKMSKETVTGHYMKFICKTLDELDKVPEMRNFYIMDNTPIQTSENITKLIETRGYRAIHLPSYSPELYSIENF